MKQTKEDKQRLLEWHQRIAFQHSQNCLQLNQQKLDNASRKSEAMSRLSSHHHGRPSQSDSHQHGRDSEKDNHHHGRETALEITQFDEIDGQLRRQFQNEQQAQHNAEQTVIGLQQDIQNIDAEAQAIRMREQAFSSDQNLQSYLSKRLLGQYQAAQRHLEQQLEQEKLALNRGLEQSAIAFF